MLDGDAENRGSVPLAEENRERLEEYMAAFNQPQSTLALDQGDYANTGFTQWGASGLAAVWAEENTRDSIFKAFKRKGSKIKDLYAVIGPCISIKNYEVKIDFKKKISYQNPKNKIFFNTFAIKHINVMT